MKKLFIRNLSFILSVSGGLIFAQQKKPKPNSVGINVAIPSQTLDVGGTVRLEKPGNWVNNGKRLAITTDGKVVTTDFPPAKIVLLERSGIAPSPGRETLVAEFSLGDNSGNPYDIRRESLILSDAHLTYNNAATRRPKSVGINVTGVVTINTGRGQERYFRPLEVTNSGNLQNKGGRGRFGASLNGAANVKFLSNANFLVFPIIQRKINPVTSGNDRNKWQLSLGHPVASTIGNDTATWTVNYIFVNKEGIQPLTNFRRTQIIYGIGLHAADSRNNGPYFDNTNIYLGN